MTTPWILLILLLVQGCSALAPRPLPAPVRDAGSRPPAPPHAARRTAPPEPQGGARVFAYQAPEQPEAAEETQLAFRAPAPSYQPAPAVKALVERAEVQRAAGDLAGAAATLERALRIDQRNPYLLNRLAQVRLEQGQFAQADSLAAKSSILAGDAPALKRDNQRIMAAARRASGR
jgi:tetratricopeptide (TPR) repeat protein